MRDIIIIGAGGFGREVQWLIERINTQEEGNKWNILGYIDDGIAKGREINGYKVLGDVSFLQDIEKPTHVVCAIGNSVIRQKLVNKLIKKENITFPNLVDPTAIISNTATMGRGNIICAGSVISTNVTIGDFCTFDWNCTVGHDADIHDFVMAYPNANISGFVKTGEVLEIGTGTQIIQGIHLGDNVIIGAGTVVIRDITEAGTYVGSPARRVK